MRRFLVGAVACAALSACLLFGQAAQQPAQTAAPVAPAGLVVGVGNFIHVVGNIDKSLEFYRDVLGMDMAQGGGGRGGQGGRGGATGAPPAGGPPAGTPAPPPAPAAAPLAPNAPRPFVSMPAVLQLYNSSGTQYRNTTVGVMEFPMRAELAEFEDADRKPTQARIQDPGASYFILTVRDIDAIMARVKKSDTATVVTAGGEPISLTMDNVKMRSVVLKDPDNFYVILMQPDPLPQTTAPPERNIIGMCFGFTVSNTDAMVGLFKNALGFAPETDAAYTSDKAIGTLIGVPGAQVKRTTALVPGSSFEVVFSEFKGVDRKPVHSDPKDPGSPVFRLRVADLDSILTTLKSNGVTVASAGGEPVTIGNAQRFAITRGPDNLFIQVVGMAPRPAPAPTQ